MAHHTASRPSRPSTPSGSTGRRRTRSTRRREVGTALADSGRRQPERIEEIVPVVKLMRLVQRLLLIGGELLALRGFEERVGLRLVVDQLAVDWRRPHHIVWRDTGRDVAGRLEGFDERTHRVPVVLRSLLVVEVLGLLFERYERIEVF